MDQLLSTTLYSRGTLTNPTLNRLLEYQRAQLEKAIDHYRSLHRAVRSNHPLSRLLSSITFPPDADALDAYEWATVNARTLANSASITSDSMFKPAAAGCHYPDSHDYMVMDSRLKPSDVLETTASNWIHLRPVTVLSHNSLQPLSHFPEGNGNTGEHYSVIGVDIPALAVMMYFWSKENSAKPQTFQETPEHFLGRYVLPNMLYSQTNATLVNLGLKDFLELSIPKEDNRLGLNSLRDYWSDIYNEWDDLQSNLLARDLRPSEYLAYLPAIEANQSLFDQRPVVHVTDHTANYPHRLLAHVNITLLAIVGTSAMGQRYHLESSRRAMERRIRQRRPLDKITNGYVREQLEHKLAFIYSL